MEDQTQRTELGQPEPTREMSFEDAIDQIGRDIEAGCQEVEDNINSFFI